jgi:hypothetical protein
VIWFYTRENESLRLETRYDNATFEYVGVLTQPDGHQETKRFTTVEDFRAWLVSFEQELTADHWLSSGDPHVFPEGWPTRKPPR